MSGHSRSGLAAFLISAGLAVSPASANPFSFIFDHKDSAPAESADASAAKTDPTASRDKCLAAPGAASDGLHWRYHRVGHRKCWFQDAAGSASAPKKVAHRHRAARHVADSEDESPARPKKVTDALAEMPSSTPASAQAAPVQAPLPETKVADAAPVGTGAVAFVPPPPLAGQPSPQHLDVESLPAAAPADALRPGAVGGTSGAHDEAAAAGLASADDAAAPEASAAPPSAATSRAEPAGDGLGPMATWLGRLMMALGLGALLVSSRYFRSLAAAPWSAIRARRHDEDGADRGEALLARHR